MAAKRIRLPNRTHGHPVAIPIPVVDSDGKALNLDGINLEANAVDPQGTKVLLSATQNGTGSNVAIVIVTEGQMETGGVGAWLIDFYVANERTEPGRYQFDAEPKETE